MFVTSGQFYYFSICVSISGICAVFLSLINLLFQNKKIIKIILDIFAYILFSFIFVFIGYKLNFPNFRIYMYFGFLIGLYLGYKSFNLILAKFSKMLYNIFNKKAKNKGRIEDERF